MARNGTIKRCRVELAKRVVRGIGKIDDDEIETVGVGIDPGEGVGVDDAKFGREQRFLIELRQHGMRRKEPGHFWIEIDEGDAFDLWIFENFADGEAITSAEHEDAARHGDRGETRMDERFVIAVFVARTELQVAVEEETQVVLEAG